MGIAKELLLLEEFVDGRRIRGGSRRSCGQIGQVHQAGIEPLLIGLLGGKFALDHLVAQEHATLKINGQHFARTKTTALNNFGNVNRQHASFGSHNEQAVGGQRIAHRTQAIAIKSCSNKVTIAENQRRRTIPRLHTAGMVLTPGALFRRKLLILLPGRRNHHLHAVQQGAARKCEQFKGVVQTTGIAAARFNHRRQIGQALAPQRRGQRTLASLHPVFITLNRVDLAIVCHQAHRLGPRPGWEGICAVAQFSRREQALIDNRLRGERGNIPVGQIRIQPALLNQAAGAV